MRVVLPLIALLLASSAGAQLSKTVPVPSDPAVAAGSSQKNCRDRIHTVRAERGLQRLEREAVAEEPLMIAAVHKTIDGCAVLVMHNDTSDVRPLPEPREPRMMAVR